MKTEKKAKQYQCQTCLTTTCGCHGMRFCPPNCADYTAGIATSIPASDVAGAPVLTPVVRRPTVAGIWSSDYVCKLGVQDHCLEILEAMENLRARKLETNRSAPLRKTMESNLANEMMDLSIILDTWAEHNKELHAARMQRFAEKAAEASGEAVK